MTSCMRCCLPPLTMHALPCLTQPTVTSGAREVWRGWLARHQGVAVARRASCARRLCTPALPAHTFLSAVQWDETALRIKAARLLGSQSLARYPGWKGDRAAVDAERERNKARLFATACLLVAPDAPAMPLRRWARSSAAGSRVCWSRTTRAASPRR